VVLTRVSMPLLYASAQIGALGTYSLLVAHLLKSDTFLALVLPGLPRHRFGRPVVSRRVSLSVLWTKFLLHPSVVLLLLGTSLSKSFALRYFIAQLSYALFSPSAADAKHV
jgi:hypothetical protein